MIVKSPASLDGNPSILSDIVVSELRSRLSNKASIVLRNDASFAERAQRWTEYQGPKFAAIVSVAEESDIRTTMEIANAHNIPFLASTAKHGDYGTLSNIQGGIQIDLSHFNKIEISDDGQYVTVGGGFIAKDLTAKLWEAGKVTVTGVCDTVGVGLWLGGGHGLLQGAYGLAADQIISLRIMLANGDIVTASETSEPDLFWALRGAGHNFGIVTEMKLRIHDSKPVESWTFQMHFFSEEHLEQVFEALGSMQDLQGPTDEYFAHFSTMPEIDPTKPTIIVLALTSKETSHLESYTSPLSPIPHLVPVQPASTVPYTSLPTILQASETSTFCIKGPTFMRFGIDLPRLPSASSAREVYSKFSQALRETPAFAASGTVMFEAYPTHAVQGVAEQTTAFPWRNDRVLVSPFMIYAPPNPELDARARELGKGIRDIFQRDCKRDRDDGMHVYLNYAHGGEGIGEIYGEEWRVTRLRELKRRYDPQGRFGFYAGIV